MNYSPTISSAPPEPAPIFKTDGPAAGGVATASAGAGLEARSGGERWRIELVAGPSAVPGVVRVRKLLKYALRAMGLKAVSVEEIPHVVSHTCSRVVMGGK